MQCYVRYDRKLGKWVIIQQDTGKIISKCDSQPQAEQRCAQLQTEISFMYKRK